jgi:hypothetical protein
MDLYHFFTKMSVFKSVLKKYQYYREISVSHVIQLVELVHLMILRSVMIAKTVI